MLGQESQGSGARPVLILNDWMCDCSTWDGARPFLDPTVRWIFADLRGYGRSRSIPGAHTLLEAAADVRALVDGLGLGRFSIVGHSMSSLVAFQVAQQLGARVERVSLISPPPPGGFGADAVTIERMRAFSGGDDAARTQALSAMWGPRLGESWLKFKVERWRATSDPQAVADYVTMFASDGLPDQRTRLQAPVLALTGEADMELMRRASVAQLWSPLCERLELASIADAGHYPMQEAPPLVAALLGRFFAGH